MIPDKKDKKMNDEYIHENKQCIMKKTLKEV